jgi:hypothetical protein
VRVALDTPFADVRAEQLTWRLGLEPQPALSVLRVAAGELTVELRLLGASHQVLVDGLCSETVACTAGGAGLPATTRTGGYRFAAHLQRPRDLDTAVGAVADALAAHPDALIGEFAGLPSAVTILHAWATRQGAAWRTWHAYPQTGELLTTRTTLCAG